MPDPRNELDRARRLRTPLFDPAVPAPETAQVSFGDLVRLLGEGIADAQAALDRSSAELVEELAGTIVTVPTGIEETVAADGTVTSRVNGQRQVSLLELGVMPSFYQFSEATVEVAMDVKVVEKRDETVEGTRRLGLFAGTASVKAERKLNRDVTVSSKLTAKLVPVPAPVRIEPTRTTTTPPPDTP